MSTQKQLFANICVYILPNYFHPETHTIMLCIYMFLILSLTT